MFIPRTIRLGAVAAAMLCVAAAASADTVELVNGETKEGVIVYIGSESLRLQNGAGGAIVSEIIPLCDVRAVRLGPPSLDAVRRIANRYDSDPEESVRLWTWLAALEPDRMEHQIGRARALRRAGRLAEAVQAARVAIRLDPDAAGAHAELAEAHLGRGESRAAALAALEVIRCSGTAPARGTALLARAFEQAGLSEDALRAWKAALRHDPLAEEAFDRCVELLIQKRSREELETLASDRIRVAPDDRRGWLALGRAQYLDGRFADAAATFKKAGSLGGPGFDRARVFFVVSQARASGKNPIADLEAADRPLALQLDPELGRK